MRPVCCFDAVSASASASSPHLRDQSTFFFLPPLLWLLFGRPLLLTHSHTEAHTQTHTWEVKFAAFWSLRSFACTLLCRFPFSCLFAKWIFLLLFMFRLHLNTISEYPAHFSMEYIGFLWLNVNISCHTSSISSLFTLCTDIILFVLALSTLFIVLGTVLQKQVCTAQKKYFKKSKTIFSLSYF